MTYKMDDSDEDSVCGGFSSLSTFFHKYDIDVLKEVKPMLEANLGRRLGTFNPIAFSRQIVAGSNYDFVIDIGEEAPIKLSVFQPLRGACEITNISS
mmetsp:Transcript_29307/g.52459  ORF Transcript_29307/g.52459 Transcript_29307/m.52459 type:complete len:97 (+) Transcript_29307:207-497(+)